MIGRRVEGFEAVTAADAQPGDYAVIKSAVWCVLPNGTPVRIPTAGDGPLWGIVEHDDGTITLSPSILLHPTPGHHDGWHGWLERGVWREA